MIFALLFYAMVISWSCCGLRPLLVNRIFVVDTIWNHSSVWKAQFFFISFPQSMVLAAINNAIRSIETYISVEHVSGVSTNRVKIWIRKTIPKFKLT
jgi:hypothetical protein